MELRALLLLTLLGLLFGEPGFGQRGDMNIDEWLSDKGELLNKFGHKLKDIEALEARVNATVDELKGQKAEADKLKEENEGLKTRLSATEEEINKLKQSNANAPRIAFSASLANFGEIYKGPCTDKALIYKRVFSNTGDGYDQNTGVFTAPVGGLYFFSFSTYGYNTHNTGAILVKNGALQISTHEGVTVDGSDSSSNAVVLQLAAGDKVSMELWDDGRVFDNMNGHTTFSGFLVFPV
ncbi:cerebellin 11 [Clinocottus analis]|uniref:cerebellin 11 n=1 Tax=Clinocottus analis TaxID=304258 RepID=UPI0035BEE962